MTSFTGADGEDGPLDGALGSVVPTHGVDGDPPRSLSGLRHLHGGLPWKIEGWQRRSRAGGARP